MAGRVPGADERRLQVHARRDDGQTAEAVEVEGAGAADAPFSLGSLAPAWRLFVRDEEQEEVAAVELDLRDGIDRRDIVLDVSPR